MGTPFGFLIELPAGRKEMEMEERRKEREVNIEKYKNFHEPNAKGKKVRLDYLWTDDASRVPM